MAAAAHYVLLLNVAKAGTNKGASAHRSESVELQLDRHSRRGRAPTASINFIHLSATCSADRTTAKRMSARHK
eukprot:4246571-Pleurochrysis_carterae.AAC.1